MEEWLKMNPMKFQHCMSQDIEVDDNDSSCVYQKTGIILYLYPIMKAFVVEVKLM